MQKKSIISKFSALADSARIDIVKYIAKYPGATASRLQKRLSIPQPTLSYHLKLLVKAGLLNFERDGRWKRYSISAETFDKLAAYLDALK